MTHRSAKYERLGAGPGRLIPIEQLVSRVMARPAAASSVPARSEAQITVLDLLRREGIDPPFPDPMTQPPFLCPGSDMPFSPQQRSVPTRSNKRYVAAGAILALGSMMAAFGVPYGHGGRNAFGGGDGSSPSSDGQPAGAGADGQRPLPGAATPGSGSTSSLPVDVPAPGVPIGGGLIVDPFLGGQGSAPGAPPAGEAVPGGSYLRLAPFWVRRSEVSRPAEACWLVARQAVVVVVVLVPVLAPSAAWARR